MKNRKLENKTPTINFLEEIRGCFKEKKKYLEHEEEVLNAKMAGSRKT